MKAMIIGISPNYNYPGNKKWREDNTFYASNHGASLIVRSLIKEFDAEYINDFSDTTYLKNKYNTCILGFSTHAHAKRDITRYVNLIEKLDIKAVVISMGVTDNLAETTTFYKLDPSVIRLLQIVSAGSEWIGVRGHYTASILQQNGFRNVVPIGCPSVFSNLKSEFQLNLKNSYDSPLVVYHKSLAYDNFNLIKNYPLLGQDYQDEAVFTSNLENDKELMKNVMYFYNQFGNTQDVLNLIRSKGIFTRSYDEWFDTISKHDFVFGARLHGCIAALLQRIPAVFTPRDLRVKEIAEFFDLPQISYDELKKSDIYDVMRKANYERFFETYKFRYKNYLSFVRENKLESQLEQLDTPYCYSLNSKDFQTINYINNIQLAVLKLQGDRYFGKNFVRLIKSFWKKTYNAIKRIKV